MKMDTKVAVIMFHILLMDDRTVHAVASDQQVYTNLVHLVKKDVYFLQIRRKDTGHASLEEIVTAIVIIQTENQVLVPIFGGKMVVLAAMTVTQTLVASVIVIQTIYT
jgi:hypothetical protein